MSSIIEIITANFCAKDTLPKVRQRLAQHVQQKGKCTPTDVEQILKSDPALTEDLPKDAGMLRLVSQSILLKFRNEQIGDADDAKKANIEAAFKDLDLETVNRQTEEIMSEAMEKMDEVQKVMLVPIVKTAKIVIGEIRSLVDAGFQGNFQMIERELSHRFGISELPYKKEIKELIRALNSGENKEITDKFFRNIDMLLDREPENDPVNAPDACEAWLGELVQSFEEFAKGLSDSDELKGKLSSVIKSVKSGEIDGVKKLFNLLLGELSEDIGIASGIKIDFDRVVKLFTNVKDIRQLRKFIGGKNFDELKVAISGLITNPAVNNTLKAVGVTIPEATVKQVREQVGQSGWGSGYGKWVIGIGSGVLAAIGLYVQNTFLKGALVGIGALGLGGIIAATSQTIRRVLGFVS